MADKTEENSEKDDKNDKEANTEGEKAKKDDANEKIKTETQEKDGDVEKESTKDNSNAVEVQREDKPMEENTESTVKEQTKTEKDTKTEEKSEKDTKTEEKSEEDTKTVVKSEKDTKTEEKSEEGTKTEVKSEKDTKTEEESEEGTKTEVKSEKDTKTEVKFAKGTKTEEKSKMVDLKFVQTHYKTHTKTTLPHILTEYGMEDKAHPSVKKEKKEKRKKKKRAEEREETDDEDRRRRKAREEKFRQTFGDNRETDTYYMEYIDFLEKKVAEQRLKAEKQREEEKRLAALREEEEWEEEDVKKQTSPQTQRQRHRLQKKLQRIELKHDDTFMKELPRTDMSRIIVLQDKMRKEGKLRTQGEVDKFWRDIKKPEVFYAQFKVNPADAGPLPASRQDSETNTNENADVFKETVTSMPPRSLSHISESSRSENQPWAITQKFQSSQGPKSPTMRKGSAQLAREAALDLEKRCPKLELPPMACFSLQLGEKPPDPEEIQKKIELRMREKSRKKAQRKLNRMYQMAMTNTAAANRILAQHNDLTSMFEGAALRDVLSVFDDPYLMGHRRKPAATALQPYPADERILEAAPPSLPSTRQSSAGSHRLTPISDTSSRSSSKSKRTKKPSLEAIEYPAPVPLSLNALEREKTMEPKCLSSMWTNYMHAGKSVFAPT